MTILSGGVGFSCNSVLSQSFGYSTKNFTSKSWRPNSVPLAAMSSRRTTSIRVQAAQTGMKNVFLNATPTSVLEDEIVADGIPTDHNVGTFKFLNEDDIPRNLLEGIVWNENVEMEDKHDLCSLKKALDNGPPKRDFIGSVKESFLRAGLPDFIAEVKRASPSRGFLKEDFHPVEVAKAYEKGGAALLSFLTDTKYFQGSFENLQNSGLKKFPLWCKEFIVDARTKGVDAILLITDALPDIDIKHFTANFGSDLLFVANYWLDNFRTPGARRQIVFKVWFIDSGAAMHVCNSKEKFLEYSSVSVIKRVLVANNEELEVVGVGKVLLTLPSGKLVPLKEVLYVPDVNNCYISVSKLIKDGFWVLFAFDMAIIFKRMNFIGKGYVQKGMFRLNVNNDH